MKNKIKLFILKFRVYIWLFIKNKGRLFITLRGYENHRKRFYPNFKKHKKEYINDVQRILLHKVNEGNQDIFSQLNSYLIFKNFVNYAEVFGVVLDKKFISYDNDYSLDRILDMSNFIVKAIDGAGGKKVLVIKRHEKNYFVNNKLYNRVELTELILSLNRYIIQEFVVQNNKISKLYDKSTNTLRVLTVREGQSNKIKLIGSLLRVGNDDSKPVDNFSSGGYSFIVDSKTGIVGEGRRYNNKNKTIEVCNTHPDSKSNINGFLIPHYQIIINKLIKTHLSLPEINMIAWDVVVTEKDYKIIEVNNTTDVDVFQIHGPILDTKEFRDFIKYHKL